MPQNPLEQLDLTFYELPFTPWWAHWWFLAALSGITIAVCGYIAYRLYTRPLPEKPLSPAEQAITLCLKAYEGLATESLSTSHACVQVTGAVKGYLSTLYERSLVAESDLHVKQLLVEMYQHGLLYKEFYDILEEVLEEFHAVKFADLSLEPEHIRARISSIVGCIQQLSHNEIS